MIGQLKDIVGQIGELKNWKEFSSFWAIVFDKLGVFLQPDSEEYRAGVQDTLKNFVDLLDSSTVAMINPAKQREHILKSALFRLDENELPGNSDNPTSPLGFYKALSPIPQTKTGFVVYAPCAVSLLEISLLGPGSVASVVTSINPQISETAFEQIHETAETLSRGLASQKGNALCKELILAIDALKLRYPFMPLIHPFSFYLEGKRFFAQGDIDYVKCGATSGFIIPEDYYGREVYNTVGPGITEHDHLAPGSFVDNSVGQNSHWQDTLIHSLKHQRAFNNSSLSINPFRPVYFDSALNRLNHNGGRFKKIIDIEQTGQQLRLNEEKWKKTGEAAAYRRDASNLLSYFLSHEFVDIYLTRSFASEWKFEIKKMPLGHLISNAEIPAPSIIALLSDRISVYSARGSLGKINHGFWINPQVIEWIQPSSEFRWENIPLSLMGLKSLTSENTTFSFKDHPNWVQKYLHNPIRSFLSEGKMLRGDLQEPHQLAWHVINELLRPNLERLTSKGRKEFLTLEELSKIFQRSYGRLRHWITQYNLKKYSTQVYDHRFRQEDLVRFVEVELRGRKRFPDNEIELFLVRIEEVFHG
jgi:hypothetical protein